MACERRNQTGSCSHFQCPFEAESAFGCVEVVAGYCEIGAGCVDRCPHSWKTSDEKTTEKANVVFRVKYGVEK